MGDRPLPLLLGEVSELKSRVTLSEKPGAHLASEGALNHRCGPAQTMSAFHCSRTRCDTSSYSQASKEIFRTDPTM
jgi:hypothetical protein